MGALGKLLARAEAVQVAGIASIAAGVGILWGLGAGLIALGAGAVAYGVALERAPAEPEPEA